MINILTINKLKMIKILKYDCINNYIKNDSYSKHTTINKNNKNS